MSDVLTIIRKEFYRFFSDRRTLIMVFMPGVLIYIVYSLMGVAMSEMLSPDKEHTPVGYAVNMPRSMKIIVEKLGFQIEDISYEDILFAKNELTERQTDLCIVFSANFDEQVEAYEVSLNSGPAPNIEIYYNSTSPNSASAYRRLTKELDEYESALANKFDINRGVEDADKATKEDISARIISTMMPLLLLIFLYSGCVAIAPESIAGEKERGTIATLLVTPLKREYLAIGKIISLGGLAFISGMSSFMGMILAIPRLIKGSSDSISVNMYSVMDYSLLALLIFSSITLLVTVISIISAYAKTVKEASMAMSPLLIIVMLIGVSAMFGDGARPEAICYIIPLYNSIQSMSGIFLLDYSLVNVIITLVFNVLYALVGGYVLTKMFNSEKFMFSK